jgi:hypothetical protein
MSFFCSPAAVRSLAERSLGELSEGFAMTGKRGSVGRVHIVRRAEWEPLPAPCCVMWDALKS